MDDELKAELARLDKQLQIEQANQYRKKDDEVSVGYVPTPLPPDHFSLQPEWLAYKAGLKEDVSVAESVSEVQNDWREYAYALSGTQEEMENVTG